MEPAGKPVCDWCFLQLVTRIILGLNADSSESALLMKSSPAEASCQPDGVLSSLSAASGGVLQLKRRRCNLRMESDADYVGLVVVELRSVLLIRCEHAGGILNLTHPAAANETAAGEGLFITPSLVPVILLAIQLPLPVSLLNVLKVTSEASSSRTFRSRIY